MNKKKKEKEVEMHSGRSGAGDVSTHKEKERWRGERGKRFGGGSRVGAGESNTTSVYSERKEVKTVERRRGGRKEKDRI